jgi:hypothetical protein
MFMFFRGQRDMILKYINGPAFISPFEHTTNNAYQVDSRYTTALLWLPKKPYTLAGFEPGSTCPEGNAMSTAPRRQGDQGDKISLWKKRLKFSLTIFCQKLLQNSYNI